MSDEQAANIFQKREFLLDRWIDECDQGVIDPNWYREDPIAKPTITVKEAYDLQLVEQGISLYARWRSFEEYSHDSQPLPSRRIVRAIDAPNAQGIYEVHTSGMRGSCDADDTLELPIEGVQAQLLFGAWLKERRNAIKKDEESGSDFSAMMDDMWGLVYPDDKTGWDYPAQVFRHVEQKIQEQAQRIKSLEAIQAVCDRDHPRLPRDRDF